MSVSGAPGVLLASLDMCLSVFAQGIPHAFQESSLLLKVLSKASPMPTEHMSSKSWPISYNIIRAARATLRWGG